MLDEVDLFEVTLTSTPANADTHVLSMKAVTNALTTTEELRRRCEEAGVFKLAKSAQPIKFAEFDV